MPEFSSDQQKKMTDEEFTKYLLDRLRQLEESNLRLIEENRKIETERRIVESQKIKQEREIRRLRSELERLRSPPLLVGVISEIIDDERVVVRTSNGPKYLVTVSSLIDKKELIPGTPVGLNQQTLAVVSILPKEKDPMVYGMEVIESPDVDYDDIGGLKEQINEIYETVELPLTNPDIFEKVGIDPPKGVLLYGPPGTGKTLLAKAVAKRTNATFIRVVGSELVQKYIGEGARLVRELFQLAREKAPSIVFIDELDAIGAKRLDNSTSGDREVQRTLMQLLAEMDGFDPRGDVKIIGATNRPDILDPALLRPGRFDRLIEIPLPDFEGRVEILRIHTRKMNLRDVDLNRIAEETEGATGADLKAIATEAGMFAIREGRDYVIQEDFLKAIRKVRTPVDRMFEVEPGVMFG
jgi:proteasome regulatory subunit